MLHWHTLERSDYVLHTGFKIVTVAVALESLRADLTYRRVWGSTIERARSLRLVDEAAALRLLRSPAAAEDAGGRTGQPAVAELAGAGVGEEADMGGRRQTFRWGRIGQGEWRSAGRTFTLVEMLVVIAIIAVLAGLLMPALSKAVDSSYKASCANNQRQLAAALGMYCDDYGGSFQPLFADDCTAEIRNNYAGSGLKLRSHGSLYPYVAEVLDVFFCASTNWPGTSWHNPLPSTTRSNWRDTLTSGYGISSYANGYYALQQLGSTKVMTMSRPPAMFTDALFTGIPPHPGSDALFLNGPAENHKLAGVNAARADGSVRWWDIGIVLDKGGAGERNTFASNYHGSTSKFWSLVSGFNLKWTTVY